MSQYIMWKIPIAEKYVLNSKYIYLGIRLNWEGEKKTYFQVVFLKNHEHELLK